MASDLDDSDPLEGSSFLYDTLQIQIKQEACDEENLNPTALLAVSFSEPLALNSTDAMENPKTGMMVCLHCLEEMDRDSLPQHMMSIHNYRRVAFRCSNCNLTFPSRNVFLPHKEGCKRNGKRVKKKPKPPRKDLDPLLVEDILDYTTCSICSIELPRYCLKEHMSKEHSDAGNPLPCSICKKMFKSKLSLREHVRLVHNAVKGCAECDLCGQKFNALKYLANHKRNVHPKGNKQHICEICGKQFKSHLCLHQHTKSVHPPDSASVDCPHCQKTFKSKVSLQQHLRVSHGVHKTKATT